MCAMTPAPAYALLGDGSTVLVRQADPADFEAVKPYELRDPFLRKLR